MRIEDYLERPMGGFVVGLAVGALGTYLINKISHSHVFHSPAGVCLSCGIITALAFTILASEELSTTLKYLGLAASYPVGIMITSLLKYRVRLFDPLAAGAIGAIGVCVSCVALYLLVMTMAYHSG